MANYVIPDQEEQVKKLKRLLEGWRMALLTLKSVLLWEQQWHPGVIIGSVSFLYFLIWIMDLNSLATFAVVGLFLNFIDFIVPVICNMLYGPSAWTGQQEKVFHDICRNIVVAYNQAMESIRSFYSLRETNPSVYHVISICMLATLIWVTSSVNNTFLLYVLTMSMFLWPGLQRTGIFNPLLSLLNMAPKIPFLKAE